MSTAGEAQRLAGFLDRVARGYPGGIPAKAIAAGRRSAELPPKRCVLLAVGTSDTLDERLATLAHAIGAKGLRLSDEQFVVRSVHSPPVDDSALASLIEELSASVVIVCGGSASPGTQREVAGAYVLETYELTQIADNADTKRRFWEHLKLAPTLHDTSNSERHVVGGG